MFDAGAVLIAGELPLPWKKNAAIGTSSKGHQLKRCTGPVVVATLWYGAGVAWGAGGSATTCAGAGAGAAVAAASTAGRGVACAISGNVFRTMERFPQRAGTNSATTIRPSCRSISQPFVFAGIRTSRSTYTRPPLDQLIASKCRGSVTYVRRFASSCVSKRAYSSGVKPSFSPAFSKIRRSRATSVCNCAVEVISPTSGAVPSCAIVCVCASAGIGNATLMLRSSARIVRWCMWFQYPYACLCS